MQIFTLKMTKTDIIGRAYFKKDGKLLPIKKQRITIFLAKMLQLTRQFLGFDEDAKTTYIVFLTCLLDTELHEHLHIIFANMNSHPWSECQVKFWTSKLVPLVAEVLDYSDCYSEVLVWLENEQKNAKLMVTKEQIKGYNAKYYKKEKQ